jgi:hypothetical protein
MRSCWLSVFLGISEKGRKGEREREREREREGERGRGRENKSPVFFLSQSLTHTLFLYLSLQYLASLREMCDGKRETFHALGLIIIITNTRKRYRIGFSPTDSAILYIYPIFSQPEEKTRFMMTPRPWYPSA